MVVRGALTLGYICWYCASLSNGGADATKGVAVRAGGVIRACDVRIQIKFEFCALIAVISRLFAGNVVAGISDAKSELFVLCVIMR